MAAPGENDNENSVQNIASDNHKSCLWLALVANCDREVVIEHSCGIFKVDTVLAPVALGLSLVPLHPHASSICTTVHTRKHDLTGFGPPVDPAG